MLACFHTHGDALQRLPFSPDYTYIVQQKQRRIVSDGAVLPVDVTEDWFPEMIPYHAEILKNQDSLKSIITGAARKPRVLIATYIRPMANQMPPVIFASEFRFHQINAQNAKPPRGRIASARIRRLYPGLAITENCQNVARFTPMKARNAPKFSNSPACS